MKYKDNRKEKMKNKMHKIKNLDYKNKKDKS